MKVIVVSKRVSPDLALSLVAESPIRAGELIVGCIDAAILPTPTWRTVQLGHNRHMQDPLVDYIDHSCEPTARVDSEQPGIVALRDIAVGEAITIYYPGSEMEQARSFDCRCGHTTCQGRIQGAFYLAPHQMRWALERGYCTTYISEDLERLLALADNPKPMSMPSY